LIFVLGVLLIVYLSWKSNPNLKELEFIPDWLSNWTDQDRNNRRRTAVPFVGLGLFTGVQLIFLKQTRLFRWILAWVILALIVCIAEAGQYFFPSRTPDIKDFMWGSAGAGVGLVIPVIAWQSISTIKTIFRENTNE